MSVRNIVRIKHADWLQTVSTRKCPSWQSNLRHKDSCDLTNIFPDMVNMECCIIWGKKWQTKVTGLASTHWHLCPSSWGSLRHRNAETSCRSNLFITRLSFQNRIFCFSSDSISDVTIWVLAVRQKQRIKCTDLTCQRDCSLFRQGEWGQLK